MHIRLSDEARHDLRAIRDYLKPLNPVACERVLISIFTTLDHLAAFPLLGKPGRIEGTREIPVSRYPFFIVYSLPDEYHIDVEAIFHDRQKYPPV